MENFGIRVKIQFKKKYDNEKILEQEIKLTLNGILKQIMIVTH